MGLLFYDGEDRPIRFDDRTLAHLKVVIATKFRRQESFTLSWKHGEEEPVGRTTIWLHPTIEMRFVFDDVDAPELNRRWIEELMQSANSTGGITLIREFPPLGA